MFVIGTMCGPMPVVMCHNPAGALAALLPRTDLWDFGGGGYMDWHQEGPARNQLALAMLAYATNHADASLALAEAFAKEALSTLDGDGWSICVLDVLAWCVHYFGDQRCGIKRDRHWRFSKGAGHNGG